MSEEALAEIRNRRIGFVFQQFNLLASMTAWQNVELPLVYAGVHRAERKERAMAALAKVGPGARVQHRAPESLSGGQQQRGGGGPRLRHRAGSDSGGRADGEPGLGVGRRRTRSHARVVRRRTHAWC